MKKNEIKEMRLEELKDLYEIEASYILPDKVLEHFQKYCSEKDYLQKYFTKDNQDIPVRYLMDLNGETEKFVREARKWLFMCDYTNAVNAIENTFSYVFSELGESFYLISEAAGSAFKSMSNVSVKSEIIENEPKDKVLAFIESKKKDKHYQKFTKPEWKE